MGKKSDLSVRIRKELRIKPNKRCILAVYQYGTLLGLIAFLIAVFIQDVYQTIPIRKDTPTVHKPFILAIYVPLRFFRLILISAVKVRQFVISIFKLPKAALRYSVPFLDRVFYDYLSHEENFTLPSTENTKEVVEEIINEDMQPEVIVQIINRTIQDKYDPQTLTEIQNKLFEISSHIDLIYSNQEKIKSEFVELKNSLSNLKNSSGSITDSTADVFNETRDYINDNLCRIIDDFISNFYIQPKIALTYKRYGTQFSKPIITERSNDKFEFQLDYPSFIDSILFKNVTKADEVPKSITISFMSYGHEIHIEKLNFDFSKEQKIKLEKPILCDSIKIKVNSYVGDSTITIIPYFEACSSKISNFSM